VGTGLDFKTEVSHPPTWFLDHFEMTIANINATSVVETKFLKQMQDSLRAAPKTLAPRAKKMGLVL
jgi:hypothetical protein